MKTKFYIIMKKHLLSLFLGLLSVSAFSQGPNNWTIVTPNITIEQETVLVNEGASSAKVTWTSTDNQDIESDPINVTGDASYSYSLDVYDNTNAGRVRMSLAFNDGTNVYDVYSVDNVNWQTLTTTGTVPTTATTVKIRLRFYDESAGWTANGSQATVYVDNAIFTENGGANLVVNGGFESWPATDTPPQATFIPTDGATNVPISQTITITFDEKIYQSDGTTEISDADLPALITVKEAGVDLPDGNFTMTYDNTTFTITIDPNSDLSYDTDYSVSFGSVYDNAAQENAGQTATFHTELGYIPIVKAYAISDDAIDVVYQSNMSSVNAGDYTLTGTANINFTNASIDGTNPAVVHLSGASATMIGDVTLDNISDGNSNADFYAGITPIANTNVTNPGGKINNDTPATFVGIVSANDGYNNVWIADAEGAYNGILIYDSNFDSQVSVGDEVKITGTITQYNNLTELKNPVLLQTISSSNTPYGPSLITGSDIAETITADTDPGEKWEGQLVKINKAEITAALNTTDYYYTATDDAGTTHFRIGDAVVYKLSGITLNVGDKINITGVVDYEDGAYRINPRDINDIHFLSSDATLSTFTLGGQDAMGLANVSVADPVNDAGATMYVADFTGFAGIAATTTNGNATFSVTLNGNVVDPADYATQALADGDVVVVTVTAEDGTMGYYKVTLTGENRSLTVTDPTGGETYNTGDVATITWSSANITNVNIYAEDNVTHDLNPIASNVTAADGTFTYTIQNGDFGVVYIRVTDASDEAFYDNSDGTVTVNDIVAPSITARYPVLDATDVPVSFTLSITFDEDIQDGSNGALEIRKTSDNSVVISKSFAELTHQDDNLTLDVSGLEYSTSYYVTIPAGFVVDMSAANGNAEVAANAWTFTTGAAPVGDLFFSEYIEGSGYNKAIEIYNPTDYDIALSGYMLKGTANDAIDWENDYPFPDGAVVPAHGTYVIVDDQANAAMLAVADWVSTGYECGFNGNDARGLFKFNGTDYDLIDVIGNPNNPGSANYSVAGIADATADHTLVRKSNIVIGNPDWTASAGTDAASSEWEVYSVDEFSYLGWHIAKSSAKDIVGFELAEQTGSANINSTSHTVDIEVVYGTDVTNLTPTITVSKRATVSPASGVAQDFTNPVTYTVTAQDGTTQDWVVTVTVASSLSSEKDILSFEISGQLSVNIDASAATVEVLMPFGTDVTSLTPTITVSAAATINPASGVAQDFTNPVTYTVTAQDGSTKDWTVTVTVQQLSLTSIYDIQYTSNSNGASPLVGQQVKTKGCVTAVYEDGSIYSIWIQDSSKAWNGIQVFGIDNTLGLVSLGDTVEVVGDVEENFNLTRLNNVTYINVKNSGNTISPLEISIADASTEAYEGVFIKLSNVECTNADAGYDMFEVSDGTYSILIDDDLYKYTATQGTRYNIVGLGHYSYSARKVLPRSASDVEVAGTKYTVTFTVTDGTTPVDGATIIVTGQGDLTTDASGQATMQLPNGDYTFVVQKDGFTTYNGSFTVADADKAVEVTLVPTGVPVNTLAKLTVYPNPFTTRINFEGAEVTRVTVTSVIGQVVLDQIVENARSIDLSNIEKGIYLVRFYNNKGESVLRKLIKE